MIQTDSVHENAYRFQFDKQIAKSDFTIESAKNAGFSPVAKKLFGFPWVEKLVIGTDFIELTKKDWVDWDIILDPLTGLLEEHFSTISLLEEPLPSSPTSSSLSSDGETIRHFIENQINPSLASHGGFIELKSFENNIAYLAMGGGCQGCASSQATMFDGVENALKSEFPFVQKVVDMTDHSSGANPYY